MTKNKKIIYVLGIVLATVIAVALAVIVFYGGITILAFNELGG